MNAADTRPAPADPPEPRNPGDEVAHDAPGAGENVCRQCGGSGRLPDGRACPACGGSGRVTTAIGGA